MLMRDASRIVTVSDYTVRRLAQEHPGCGRKLRRVYNGLDLQPWRDASKGTPAGIGNRKIYSIGRLIEKKGFDDLIRASAILRDHGVSHSVHIVGGGPEEEALRKLIEQLGLSSHVFLEGEWDQNRIIQALASDSHLFALACVTEKDGGMDNLPTVLMEAMAIGLPCVSTRLAGVPEMVIDGQTGLLCEERKPEDLANLLERLLGDEALCRTYGKNGFQLAAERFDQAVTSRILQRALVSGGDICFDPELIQRHPQLLADYVKEAPARVVRAIRQRPQFSAEQFMADSAH
jgi:glycosyltransferase involved in cell wall biosynthesis